MLGRERQTLNDLAYAKLRQELISGHFQPGQILVIRKLAEAFGISATPIREALQRLVAERILIIEQNRSIAVPLLSAGSFRELVRIRCTVEGLAGKMAAEKIGDPQIELVRAMLPQMDQAIAAGDGHRYLALNEAFHFAIYSQAEAPILLEMIRDLWGRVGPYMTYLIEIDTFLKQANDHHEKVVEALEARHLPAVQKQIVNDIKSAANAIFARLEPRPDR